MKIKFLSSTLILASSLVTGFGIAADKSMLTREEVKAEYKAAKAAGTLPPTGEGPYVKDMMSKPASSKLTREEVKAEYKAAKAAGTLPPMGEGEYLTSKIKSASSQLTREEVKAETRASKAPGAMPPKGNAN